MKKSRNWNFYSGLKGRRFLKENVVQDLEILELDLNARGRNDTRTEEPMRNGNGSQQTRPVLGVLP
ncbi:unnamed protein product, partial [Allacma fusca]